MIEVYVYDIEKSFNNPLIQERIISLSNSGALLRVKSYINMEDKLRSLLGELLIRIKISEKIGVDINEVSISRSNLGKPYLDAPHQNIHFNISHASNWVACAVSDCPIGIDIENTRRFVDCKAKNIIDMILTPREISQLEALDISEKAFYLCEKWTQKESYVKALGVGFQYPFKLIESELRNDKNFVLKYKKDKPLMVKSCKIIQNIILSICINEQMSKLEVKILDSKKCYFHFPMLFPMLYIQLYCE